MTDTVVAINAGSSSVKFAHFGASADLPRLVHGQIEGIGRRPVLELYAGSVPTASPELPPALQEHSDLIGFVLEEIIAPQPGRCIGVGHRIVHGGNRFSQPTPIDHRILHDLAEMVPLARSHQPHNLAGVRAARSVWPDIPQIACFDTAFHHTVPRRHSTCAIPKWLRDEGVRRYGFHGLSYEAVKHWIAEFDHELARARVVVAHLGNGASLCGMLDGESRYTSMGFTPLDGLVMGRRPGRLDPGVVLYLAQEKQMNPKQIADLLNQECGLIGLSGTSPDMRELLADASAASVLAVEVFLARLACEIGSACAAIGGLDALVFTGGIGQNSEEIRARAASELSWLGVSIDAAANRRNRTEIGCDDSRVRVFVLPADEERMIARHTINCLDAADIHR